MRVYTPGTMVTLHPRIEGERDVAVLKPDRTLTTVVAGTAGMVVCHSPFDEVEESFGSQYLVLLVDGRMVLAWQDKVRVVR